MTSRKKKKQPKRSSLVQLIGRLGAPQNLRPAGAHKDGRRVRRQKIKLALQRELAEAEPERTSQEHEA